MVVVGVALSLLMTMAVLVLRRRRDVRAAIEVGTVSPGWLAEFKLGKRETNWD